MKSNPPTMKGKVMMSKLKTAIISSVFAVGALAALIPVPVHAADRNGYGIVYHRSDCGAYGVRQYGGGGDWSGSSCGYWIGEWDRMIVWSQDWNWSTCDLVNTRAWAPGYGAGQYESPSWSKIYEARDRAGKCGF